MYSRASLHQSFRGQAVVIEAHGIEDVEAVHTPKPGNKIGLAIGINMTQMQLTRDRRWRGINREDRGAPMRLEMIDALLLPGSL